MLEEFDLTNQIAIITGGNGGIGHGIAIGLARAGADIIIAARNEEKTTKVVKEIRSISRQCMGIRCDVTDRNDMVNAVEIVLREFGKLNILVNCAGISNGGPPQSIPEETWESVLTTNLKATFQFCQTVYPALVKVGGGKIINIGSEYSIFGSAIVLPYSVSKGGVIQLTKSLAVAWAEDNIQVNAIIPGWIRTDMTAGVINTKMWYDAIVQRTPAGRFGEPTDVAGAAIFLSSHASDFITGQSIIVDGGYSIA